MSPFTSATPATPSVLEPGPVPTATSGAFGTVGAARAAAPPFAFAGGYAPRCAGIHALHRDGDGRVRAVLAAELAGSPTWLHLADDGRRLHALLEESHELVSFDVAAADGALTLIARHPTGGVLPVHLQLDGAHAWIAHYGDGTLRRAPVGADGALGAPDMTLTPRAGGEPHAHMVRRHPRWPLMLASDLGQDLLRAWRMDAGPRPVELDGLALPSGSGPRHFVFHPRDDGQLYLLNEQANALDWLGLDAHGRLTPRARLSSLPAGFEGLSHASDLLAAPDGRRLFALNRLHDGIAVFDLDAQGRPAWTGEVWAQGSYPRSATFSPDGRELWVCLQRSHQICVFELDDACDGTGLPRFSGRFIDMPGAASLVFRQR
ncbi:hypothetical protein CDN99_18980 [Roseateles aquatilis]|uniref:6-phosphogluconolactonase n=1 Tax=Roseateles aquatilis TaxID=431061 RepID=A0A246J3Q6_9BURK|nr:beta-propeller fold lactonase family protein [Roseateles aquatilis]OWQ86804.1 hypothetical protein CDN99_18980 [Roseateles aquatilis]